MSTRTGKKIFSVFFVVLLLLVCNSAYAQQEKGDIEVLFFSSGFFADVEGRKSRTRFSDGTVFEDTNRSIGVSLGASVGYFITRKHELGGGLNTSLFRSKFCSTKTVNGQVVDEDCESELSGRLGINGFYRYNFAREGAKRFPFIGGDVSVADVTNRFSDSIIVRPHVGYKYFFNRNVALDFSVGYLTPLKGVDNGVNSVNRAGSIDGRFSLSFVF